MLRDKRFYTYAAVSDIYRQQLGEAGVAQFLESSFAESVKANGGYGAVLEQSLPLSARQVRSIGLTPHKQATWYRLEGTGIESHLVGQVN